MAEGDRHISDTYRKNYLHNIIRSITTKNITFFCASWLDYPSMIRLLDLTQCNLLQTQFQTLQNALKLELVAQFYMKRTCLLSNLRVFFFWTGIGQQ